MSTPVRPSTDQQSKIGAVVGKGFNSDVYAWNEGRVLKLFHRGISDATIQREFNTTRAIHSLGLPVPSAHEVVDVEGRRGIVLERIQGVSLLEQVQARPWTLFQAARQLADLQARIHACAAPAELVSQRDWVQKGIDAAPNLTAAEKLNARQRLDELPDGCALCHGDFHPGNIIVTSRGPVIIDWETATRGNPLGDVACTSRLMRTADLPSWAPFYMHLLLKASRRLLHRTYLSRYLRVRPGSCREIQVWEESLAAARGRHVEIPIS